MPKSSGEKNTLNWIYIIQYSFTVKLIILSCITSYLETYMQLMVNFFFF